MREWRLWCALCAVAIVACDDPGSGTDGGADAMESSAAPSLPCGCAVGS